ncbi:MAG: restriction endonuclease [Acidobacteriales bacterium]|nr:restriction endonuclease [Terriglobales bacterium]
MPLSQSLVIPSNIPWSNLKHVDLEECLYWLLDALGAKDLEWRKGGKSGGGTDQGRDLEATFHLPTPDGELDAQRWWVESKGRSKTVESAAIKEAVVNAAARSDIAVVVIATNTQFSNPTRDWVKEWQNKHPRPKIQLWDRERLERMLVKHPAVAVRLFPEALSAQGRIEAARSRFWNQCYLPAERELLQAWKERNSVAMSPEAALALAAGEVANGNLNLRPWMMLLSDDELKSAVVLGIVNAFHLLLRAERLGTDTTPIEGALANTVMTALHRLPFEEFWSLIGNLWSFAEGEQPPAQLRQAALHCAVDRMAVELADVCSTDCPRVTCDYGVVSDGERLNYWKRFRLRDDAGADDNANESAILVIEKMDASCTVGLSLSDETRCPLIAHERDKPISKEMLETFRTIIAWRVQQLGVET